MPGLLRLNFAWNEAWSRHIRDDGVTLKSSLQEFVVNFKIKRTAKLKIPLEFSTVISGGQIGADIAGLRAAKHVGLKTGGNMPNRFMALDGLHPEYAKLYGMVDDSAGYKSRTFKNVGQSDATIRLATNFSSRGELCTLNAIKRYDKPYYDVDMVNYNRYIGPDDIVDFIIYNQVTTLNIAGNANVELEKPIYELLVAVFSELVQVCI